MKIPELRIKIKDYTKEDLATLVTELYKAIPKAMREERNLDALINDINQYKTVPTSKRIADKDVVINVEEIETFISNAEEQYYQFPNKIVSKQERPKWRFKVRAWHRDLLIAIKQNPDDIKLYGELLQKLFVLMCKAQSGVIFNTTEPFNSIGIEAEVFLENILHITHSYQTPDEFVNNAISISWNLWDTSSTTIAFFKQYGYLEMGIEKTIAIWEKYETDYQTKLSAYNALKPKERKNMYPPREYDYTSIQNTLADFIILHYKALEDVEEIVTATKKYHKRSPEVILYILVSNLLATGEGDVIVREITAAEQQGVKPRASLLSVKEQILLTGEVPRFIR